MRDVLENSIFKIQLLRPKRSRWPFFYIKTDFLSDFVFLFMFCLVGITKSFGPNVITFCPPGNVFIVSISLLKHCQYFQHENVFMIFTLGRNTVIRVVFPNTLPGEQGVYCLLWYLWVRTRIIHTCPCCKWIPRITPLEWGWILTMNLKSVLLNW